MSLKLVKGAGSEKDGACWMSAIHMFTRSDNSWSDHPDCVSPIVRELCIALNDDCPDGEREALIGQHLFAPLGTNTGEADDQRRAYLCADRAVRYWAPAALEAAGLSAEAGTLRALSPIVDERTALAAEAAAKLVEDGALAMTSVSARASAGAWAWVSAWASGIAWVSAWAWARASAWASASAGMRRELLQLILDCCAIGTPVEVVPSRTKKSVMEYLEK